MAGIMRIAVWAFVLTSCVATEGPHNAPVFFTGTLSEGESKALEEGKLLLLDFVQDSCAGCALLQEQFFENPEFRRYLGENFVVFRLPADSPDAPRVWGGYHVVGTPTVVMCLPGGTELGRILSYAPPPETFREELEAIRRGERSLKRLEDLHAARPGDLAVTARLVERAFADSDLGLVRRLVPEILSRAEESRRIRLRTKITGGATVAVDAYEFSRYTRTLDSPSEILAFVEEFPGSPLRDAALRNIAWFFDPKVSWSFRSEEDRLRQVEKTFDAALDRFPQSRLLVRTFMQYCLLYKKDRTFLERAAGLAAAVVEKGLAGGDPEFLVNYADLLALLGRPADALEVYGDSFIRRYRDSTVILRAYSSYWGRAGLNFESALWAAKRLASLREGDPGAWIDLAYVQYRMERFEKAAGSCRRALELDPASETARRILEVCEAKIEGR